MRTSVSRGRHIIGGHGGDEAKERREDKRGRQERKRNSKKTCITEPSNLWTWQSGEAMIKREHGRQRRCAETVVKGKREEEEEQKVEEEFHCYI